MRLSPYSDTKGKVVVSVEKEKCTGCSLCEELCNWEAIVVEDGQIEIVTEKCEGCGVCVCSCPEGALRLENMESIRELARG